MQYAQVMIDIANQNVDKTFEYLMPEGMELEVGQRVIVPFGKGNRPKEGYVIGLTDQCSYPSEKLKPISRKAEGFSAYLPEQIQLAKWMSQRYRCFMVEALRLMIPAQMRGERVHEKTALMAECACNAEKGREILEQLQKRAPRQAEVLDLLLQCRRMLLRDIQELIPNAQSACQALQKKGWITIRPVQQHRSPYHGLIDEQGKEHVLTEQQRQAKDAICAAMEAGQGRFLLHGATGSGKTEVYLQAIDACLKRGNGAIVLVPEISLTPQMVGRFRARFSDCVAVMHSRLSAGERYDEYKRVRDGAARVVIGPRSAVFAPVERLGLIIMDEEHEQSYKSEQKPQYDAAEVAQKRCQMSGGVLVLGSATPSVSTYYRCMQGDMTLLTMPERIARGGLPKVHVADMRKELAQGNRTIFSGALYAQMEERLKRKEQIMLFINRRGYSSFLMCRGCGYVFECEDCDVSMTYHKTRYGETLRCHYCGKQRAVPEVCPECGKPYLKQFGIGTQQVEEQVHKHFPSARTLRMDLDTTRKKDAHMKILQAFGKGEADILIGTQMIAKGLDFGGVTLVGVIAADSSLHLPDYRSAERTFELIMQVAGRAGRDQKPGVVVVQTYDTEHYALEAAVAQDYKMFYAQEIQNRRIAQFPPFATFVRLLFRGEQEAVTKASEGVYRQIDAYFKEREIVPLSSICCPAPLSRIKGEYRMHILIKLAAEEKDQQTIDGIYRMLDGKYFDGCTMQIEINPQNML